MRFAGAYFLTGVTAIGSTGVSTAAGVCCCWQETKAAAVRARTVIYFISFVFLWFAVCFQYPLGESFGYLPI